MNFYLFNPEHDMALASFSAHYKAPTEIIKMRNDLAGLPAWYASKDALAWVASSDYTVEFVHQCINGDVVPFGKCCEESLVLSSILSECVFSPWGWDPALTQFLKTNGADHLLLPDSGQMERIRILSGRQQCVKVLSDFKEWSQICGEATVCATMDEVKTFLKRCPDVILKAPWSGSGRGLTRTSETTWNANLEGWVRRILRTQGSIMAEPIYNKVVDFAMEFYMNSSHQLTFAGYSLFETDSHGNYKENVLASNERLVNKLTQYVPLSLLEKVKNQLLISLSELLGTDYVGYFGVDMMICGDESVTHDKVSYKVHPCVEINLRMNMGVVARLMYDRYVSVDSEGSYVVEHYSNDGEAIEHDSQLRALYPSHVKEGKMVEGYFPLTPVTKTTRYQCYVICHLVG